VGCEEHRAALAGFGEDCPELPPVLGVEAGGGFVEEHDARGAH
jgi:hypothetical protein